MFRKPFKIKSNSQIKGSERKKIRSQLIQQYPSFSSSSINELVPTKDEITHMKLVTSNGRNITVYCIGQNPSFFIDEDIIYPTVYTLWKFPSLLPVLTTWPLVFDKLTRGADLMLPGLIFDQDSEENLESLRIGDVCAVKLAGNKSAIAVGTLAVSGSELKLKGKKGKAMILVHIYKDLLYSLGDCSELPILKDKMCFINEMDDGDDDNDDEERNSLSVIADDLEKNLEILSSEELEATEIDESNSPEENKDVENNEEKQVLSLTEQMDLLLLKCFLTTIKSMGKNLQLPILTSTFYRTYMLGCCPTDNQFDIKKTSYKKLSNFLQEMKMKNIINVEELNKGVESITDINLSHELIKSFEIDPDFIINKTDTEAKEAKPYQVPEIKELYVVNAAVLPFFTLMNYSKGTAVSSVEVRKILTEYVKSNNLQNPQNKREVILDPILSHVLLNKGENISSMPWEDVHSKCLSKMQQAHEIIFPGKTPIFRKGKLNQIEISVEQRTGNKKVTLINYLEDFKIDAEKFAHEIQLGVAASTKVGEAAGKKGIQVLVQGNQVKYISKLLLDKYKIPKKYVKGCEVQHGKKK